MLLYHGSRFDFDTFDLSFAKIGKDFGKGIYLTTNYNQASVWALRKDNGFIYTYEFDETILERENDLSIKALTEYNEEWLRFIVDCRFNRYEPDYDLIYDRMADNTFNQLIKYLMKFNNNPNITAREIINKIKWSNSSVDQYCFKTDKALAYLKFVEKKEVCK